jgi:hypothetical protein
VELTWPTSNCINAISKRAALQNASAAVQAQPQPAVKPINLVPLVVQSSGRQRNYVKSLHNAEVPDLQAGIPVRVSLRAAREKVSAAGHRTS